MGRDTVAEKEDKENTEEQDKQGEMLPEDLAKLLGNDYITKMETWLPPKSIQKPQKNGK